MYFLFLFTVVTLKGHTFLLTTHSRLSCVSQVSVRLWSCLWISWSSSVLECRTATMEATETWPAWVGSTITTLVGPMPSLEPMQTEWRNWIGCSISSSALRMCSPWPVQGFWWFTPVPCLPWEFSECLTVGPLCCWERPWSTSWLAWATSLRWPSSLSSCGKPTTVRSVRRESRCIRAKGTRALSVSITVQISQWVCLLCWGCLFSSLGQC